MNYLRIFTKTQLFVIGLLFALILFTLAIYLFFPKLQPSKTAPEQISPLQKTIIGKTSDAELKRTLTGEATGSGEMLYKIPTSIPLTQDQIITKDGVVVFEKINLPVNKSTPGYAKVSDFNAKFGEPEGKLQGSVSYGPFVNTYLYPSKGFAFVGNAYTDEVYELQTFTPMTVEMYKQLYGGAIYSQPPAL